MKFFVIGFSFSYQAVKKIRTATATFATSFLLPLL